MSALRHLHKAYFIFMLVALAALQSACGFHLRGVVSLPDHITPIFLDLSTSNDEMGRGLQVLLSSSGDHVLAVSKAEAKTILKISNVQKKQRVVAVDDLGRAREYELKYQFLYELKNNVEPSTQAEIIKTNTVKLKRNWLFDPNSVLAVGHEKEALYGDMKKDAAQVMLRQLMVIKE